MRPSRSFKQHFVPTHLKTDALRWKPFIVDVPELEGAGDGLILTGDRDYPLIAVLLDLHDRRRLQERVRELGLADALDKFVRVLARHVLVLADDMCHDDRYKVRINRRAHKSGSR